MVQAVLLLRVPREFKGSSTFEDRIRRFIGVRNLFKSVIPWDFGVLIEADDIDKLMSITDQIRSSFKIKQSDLFIKKGEWEEREEEKVVKPKAASPFAATRLFEEVSTSLRRKRGAALSKDLSPTSEDSQRLAEDVLQLDFTKIVNTLQSDDLTTKLKSAPRDDDSTRKLTLALYELFLELSRSYEGRSIVKEALGEISQEFKRLSGASRKETYFSRLGQLTRELGRIVEVRNVYFRNAQAAGFEQDFVNLIRGLDKR